MQQENSEIETETIQRLQLVDKFGDDAEAALRTASSANLKIRQDLEEQRKQHSEVITEQE